MLGIKQIFTNAHSLLDIVRFLGNTTNLKISAELKMMRDYAVTNERDPTKIIFDEALGILIEKFPFPDKRILKLKIFETKVYHWSLYEPTDEYHESPLRFSINYGESGATLTASGEESDSGKSNSSGEEESESSDGPEEESSDESEEKPSESSSEKMLFGPEGLHPSMCARILFCQGSDSDPTFTIQIQNNVVRATNLTWPPWSTRPDTKFSLSAR